MAPGMAGSKFFRVAMDRGQVFGRKSVKTTLNLIPIALDGSVRMKFRWNPDEFRRNPDEIPPESDEISYKVGSLSRNPLGRRRGQTPEETSLIRQSYANCMQIPPHFACKTPGLKGTWVAAWRDTAPNCPSIHH